MKFFLFLSLLLSSIIAQSQELSIALGAHQIGENQTYTISIISKNGDINKFSKFPTIKGFQKQGTSSSSQTQIINGRVSSTHSITMNYRPSSGQGRFTLSPFTITVNGFVLNSPGMSIQVNKPVQRKSHPVFPDPFDSFFGRAKREPTEFIDIKEEAFFSLLTNKKSVYVGEGFTLTLAFYVAESNQAPLQFYELGSQLSEIFKLIKPSNCWEENFNIEQINGEKVDINGKNYTQYKLYQGAFYPLNNEPITFPPLALNMIKYKVAKNPSFFGQNRQENLKKFTTKGITVNIKELPPHPYKNKVAVGNFTLKEKIDKSSLFTGESFNYDFSIYGEGNISSLMAPIMHSKNLELYPPTIQQEIRRTGNRVMGSKNFSYYGIPKEPGVYPFNELFEWIYFNLKKDDYDTLKGNINLYVKGESLKNKAIISNDLGDFYNLIEVESNKFIYQKDWDIFNISINIVLFLLITISILLIYKIR